MATPASKPNLSMVGIWEAAFVAAGKMGNLPSQPAGNFDLMVCCMLMMIKFDGFLIMSSMMIPVVLAVGRKSMITPKCFEIHESV